MMNQIVSTNAPQPRMEITYAMLAGVRTHRLLAYCIDFLVICILSWIVGLFMVLTAFATNGNSFAFVPLLPLIGVFYSGLTVSSSWMGTLGMIATRLKATDLNGNRLDFIVAAGHALLFYLFTPFLVVVSLFSPEKRTLHDYFTGVIITRRVARY